MNERSISSKTAFFGLLAALIITIVGIIFMLQWANGKLQSQNEAIVDKRAQVNELDRKIAQAQQFKSDLQELEEFTEVVETVLPESKSQENIVGELVSIASTRGLTLDSISFSGSADAQNPETSQTERVEGLAGVFSLTVQTQIVTDYENVLQFLEDLENNRRQFEVNSLSITPSETGESFTVILSIVTYVKP